MKIKRQRRRDIADKNQSTAVENDEKNFRFNFYLNWDMYDFF